MLFFVFVFKKELRLQYWDILLKINNVKHTNQRRDILAMAVYCQSAVSQSVLGRMPPKQNFRPTPEI